jgi:tryptophanyl-tRNA synthetase
MDLQNPTSKMSKSGDDDSGVIYLLDEPTKIEKKFKRAVTDSDSEVIFDREKKPGIANLLEILAAATNSTPQKAAESYTRYGDLKSASADAVITMLAPIQKRYNELLGDKAELMRLIHKGNDRAQAVASATLARAQKSIGFLSSK